MDGRWRININIQQLLLEIFLGTNFDIFIQIPKWDLDHLNL